GEIAYMLANGQGKRRARRDGSALRPAQWRGLFFCSGEIFLADKMTEIGKKPRAGQMVRLSDIPAAAGAGIGLFQNLHGAPSPAAFADQLRRATLICYGAPIRAFLRGLTAAIVNDRARALKELKVVQDRFVAIYLPPDCSRDGSARPFASRPSG